MDDEDGSDLELIEKRPKNESFFDFGIETRLRRDEREFKQKHVKGGRPSILQKIALDRVLEDEESSFGEKRKPRKFCVILKTRQSKK